MCKADQRVTCKISSFCSQTGHGLINARLMLGTGEGFGVLVGSQCSTRSRAWPRHAAVRKFVPSSRCGESATALGGAEQQIRARDEVRREQQGSQNGAGWGEKRTGNPCFKDDRKPGNAEQGWEVQREGEDRLPSMFSNSKQDTAGQEAALS